MPRITFPGLLALALDAWYQRSYPLDPRRRSDACAAEFNVSPTLLWRYTQLDFGRRADGD